MDGSTMAHDGFGAENRNVSPQSWAARLSDVWDVGVIVLGPDHRLQFASGRARILLGVSTEEELEERWRSVQRQVEPILRESGMGRSWPLQGLATSSRSSQPDLRVQVYVIEEEECVAYLVLLQELDRATAMERSLRHAAHSRSILSLARDNSHDLKDVLNVISMNIELLSRVTANASLTPAQLKSTNRCTDVVRRELRRLDESLDALLARDMIERPSPRTFDLKTTCESVLHLVAARAARQHVHVQSTMSEGTAEVTGFPDRLHGALLSLLINALDAMPTGGTLQLVLAKKATIEIRLCDSGPGIPKERLPDVWKLHFTTNAGTGLGLYVARSTVEAHGGRIGYQPNPEGGSCFTIELPAAVTS
jgi:two-component system sensor histidine kinase HydH